MTVSYEKQVSRLHQIQLAHTKILMGEMGGAIYRAAKTYDERIAYVHGDLDRINFGIANRFGEGMPVSALGGGECGINDASGKQVYNRWFDLKRYNITVITPTLHNGRMCCVAAGLHLPALTEVTEREVWTPDSPLTGAEPKQYDVHDPYMYDFPYETCEIVRDMLNELQEYKESGEIPDLDATRTAILRPQYKSD